MPLRACLALAACIAASLLAPSCGSSSSTAPSTTTQTTTPPVTTVLAISGTTILDVGMTSQLTAKNIAGIVVADAQWSSLAPAVATVSASGLVTAVSTGTATIRATASGSSGTVGVLVQAPTGSVVTLSTCTNITQPGRYIVDRDMPDRSPCMSLQSVSNVQLDCQGHWMRAIVMTNVSASTVENCLVAANVKITGSVGVTVSRSTIANGILWAVSSSGIVFDGNTATVLGTGFGAIVVLDGGSNNRVTNNVLVGGYNGTPSAVGTDDGVIVTNETGDVIEGNTISDFYDAGVEGVAAVTNTRIANNVMSNIGVAGVSSYWCTRWSGNVVEGNSVTRAPQFAQFVYLTGSKCGAVMTPASFVGNRFVGNSLRNATAPWLGSGGRKGMFVVIPEPVSSNLIRNNDFGTEPGPQLTPLTGFINGGGNICGPFDPNVSNFDCAAAALGLRRR